MDFEQSSPGNLKLPLALVASTVAALLALVFIFWRMDPGQGVVRGIGGLLLVGVMVAGLVAWREQSRGRASYAIWLMSMGLSMMGSMAEPGSPLRALHRVGLPMMLLSVWQAWRSRSHAGRLEGGPPIA